MMSRSMLLPVIDIGHTVGQYIERRSARWGRRYYASMACLLVIVFASFVFVVYTDNAQRLFVVPLHVIEGLLPYVDRASAVDRFFARAISLALVALGYLLFLSFPASALFRLVRRSVTDSRPKLRSPARAAFLKNRLRASKDAYFAGIDVLSGEPVFISDETRMEHTQIVGVTGGGKTEGGIVPPLVHDIAWGRGAVVIDMKGDRSLLEKIAAAVIAAGRVDDLLFFSLSNPSQSNTYNPLLRGNASEIKDKIISSNIWSEIYYKKASEIGTLGICQALKQLERPVTFAALLGYMRNVKKIEELRRELEQRDRSHNLASLLGVLDGKTRDLAGLVADFTAMVDSDFGPLLSPEKGEIDLLDAYLNNKIVLFQLNTGLYQETAIRLARVIIQDIKTASNYIQSYTPPAERHFYPVFIDEFASIAFDAFVELVSKARSSKMAISIAHQSLGDLKNSSEGFQNQIFDNTNTRFVYRQNSAESRDLITKMAGTVEMEKVTYQTESAYGMNVNTGVGSIRRVEAFQVDPNLITEFPTGYCALLQHKKGAGDRIRYMKSDYIDISAQADFLKERVDLETAREPEKPMVEIVRSAADASEADPLKRHMALMQ